MADLARLMRLPEAPLFPRLSTLTFKHPSSRSLPMPAPKEWLVHNHVPLRALLTERKNAGRALAHIGTQGCPSDQDQLAGFRAEVASGVQDLLAPAAGRLWPLFGLATGGSALLRKPAKVCGGLLQAGLQGHARSVSVN